MKYLVMERHPGYVVVLDEAGRFWKAADLGYEVGQTAEQVVLMRQPESRAPKVWRAASAVAAAAACMILLFTVLFRTEIAPYGSVYLEINPSVRLDVDRENTVLGLEGMNEDGESLTEGYRYQGKKLETVADELVELAEEMGFLSPGGEVHIYLDSADQEWAVQVSGDLGRHLHEMYESIVIDVSPAPPAPEESAPAASEEAVPPAEESGGEQSAPSSVPAQEVIIPVTPPASSSGGASEPSVPPETPPSGGYSESDYGGDSGYGVGSSVPAELPAGDDGASDYGGEAEGDSGYEEASSAPEDSGYEETPSAPGDSGYDAPEESAGDSGYISPSDEGWDDPAPSRSNSGYGEDGDSEYDSPEEDEEEENDEDGENGDDDD